MAVEELSAPARPAPLNATFFAFKKREKRGVLFAASAAFSVSVLILFGALIAFNFNRFGAVAAWYADLLATLVAHDPSLGPPEMPFPPQALFALIPSYALAMVVTIFLLAAYEAACLRWLTRGEVSGFFGLSLNADMWRVWFTYWAWLGLIFVGYVAMIVLVIILTFAVVFVASLLHGGEATAGLIALVGVPLAYVFPIIMAVRFAPAAALSVARRRFSFFAAWRATRGRFWALLGSFALLWLLAVLAVVAVYVLAAVGAVTLSGITISEFADYASPSEAFEALAQRLATPPVLAAMAVCYALSITAHFALYVALFGVNARAALAAIEEGKVLPPTPKVLDAEPAPGWHQP